MLQERGLYSPTERDVDEFTHIEDYLAVDPRSTEANRHDFPRSGVRQNITALAMSRGMRQAILEALEKANAPKAPAAVPSMKRHAK